MSGVVWACSQHCTTVCAALSQCMVPACVPPAADMCCMPAVTRTVTPFKQGVPSGMQRAEQVVMRQLKMVGRSQAQALQQHDGCPVVCSGELGKTGSAPGVRAVAYESSTEALQQHAGRPVVIQVSCLRLALRLASRALHQWQRWPEAEAEADALLGGAGLLM